MTLGKLMNKKKGIASIQMYTGCPPKNPKFLKIIKLINISSKDNQYRGGCLKIEGRNYINYIERNFT